MSLTYFRILLAFNMNCKSISFKVIFEDLMASNAKLAVSVTKDNRK